MNKANTVYATQRSTSALRRTRMSARRRAVAVAAALLAAQGSLQALPQNGVPTFGTTSISTDANKMTILQGTQRAGIDWQSFSIGAGEFVKIQQPGTSSILFNRVLGPDPSLLFGSLQANGRVFLSNPRGIVFGVNSFIDVGSLVATTLKLSDESMLAGSYNLAGDAQSGSIVQQGHIKATGTVALVAPVIEQSGTIEAPRIGMAAAESVRIDLDGDGLVFMNVKTETAETRLRALGKLQADGGVVDLRAQARAGFTESVLNLDGIVLARGLGERNGQIFVDGGTAGITEVRGTLDASAAEGTGGNVTVLGQKVGLFGTATLDASGSTGGGNILVGGNFFGKGPERNSDAAFVDSTVKLNADATGDGSGGNVVVWSDLSTRFFGSITARGAGSGSGGMSEVSGKKFLQYAGTANLSSPSGKTGTLLLDPTDVIIDNTENDPDFSTTDPFTPTAAVNGGAHITWATIGTNLETADVTVTTVGSPDAAGGTGKITIADSPGNNVLPDNTARMLTLQADTGGIAFEAPVTIPTSLTLESKGAITQTSGSSIVVNGSTTFRGVGGGTGTYAVTLEDTGNDFKGLVTVKTSGDVSLTSKGTLKVALDGAGSVLLKGVETGVEVEGDAADLKIVSSGTTQFTGDTTIDTTLEIRSDGTVTQPGGKITASELKLNGDGAVTLTDSNNAVDTIAMATGSGNVRFENSKALAIDTVDGTDGITRTGEVSISADGKITISQDVSASVVRLQTTTGDIEQTAGKITATSLAVNSDGNVLLPGTTNAAGTVALQAGGSVVYGSAAGYAIGSVSGNGTVATVTGIGASTSTGVVELTTSSGTVTQTEPITSASLLLRGAAGYTLVDTDNAVAKLAADGTSGVIRYRDTDALAVDSVTPVDGSTAVDGITRTGNVELRAGAALTLTEAVDVGTATLELNAASGTVTQAADITAGNLLLRGAAAYTLTRSGNDVDKIAATTGAGVIRFTDTDSLAVDSVTPVDGSAAVAGITRTGSVELKAETLTLPQKADVGSATLELNVASGTVTQSGDITAGNLLLRGAAGYTLTNSGNNVAKIAADGTSGAIRYRDTDALTVDSVTPVDGSAAVAGITRTGNVELRSDTLTLTEKVDVGTATVELNAASGTVTQAANITAGNLLLRGGAAYTLTRVGNDVDKIAATTGAGAIRYADADGLAVDSVTPVDGSAAVDGITRTGNVGLNTAGTLTLAKSVGVGSSTVTLQTTVGSISQTGGSITAGELGAIAAGDVLLGQTANAAGKVALSSPGSVLYGSAGSYLVTTIAADTAPVVGTARQMFDGAAGISASTSTGLIELNTAAGTVTQDQDLTAQNLLLRGAGGYTLTRSTNDVTKIAADGTAGVIQYRDTDDLTLDAVTPIAGAPAVEGITRTGNVSLQADLLTLTKKANVGSATLELNVASGTVTQAEPITAGNLLVRGAAAFDLTQNGNNVGKLAADSGAGAIRYVDTNALSVDAVTPVAGTPAISGIDRTGNVGLNTGGTLTIAQNFTATGSTVTLQVTSGDIDQTGGALTATNLGAIVLAGDAKLGRTTNTISKAAVEASGSVLLGASTSYEVASAAADATAVANSPAARQMFDGADGLAAHTTTGVIELNTPSGTVTQTQDIVGASLLLRGGAEYLLTRGSNDVKNIAASSGAGTIKYTDATALAVSSVTPVSGGGAIAGIDRTGDVELNAVGTLTLTQNTKATGKKLLLESTTSSISQTGGTITATELGAVSLTGNVLLGNTGNTFSKAGISATNGNVLLGSSTSYEVAAIAADSTAVANVVTPRGVFSGATGIIANTTTGVIELNTADGTVTQSENVTANSLLLRGAGAYTLARGTNDVAKLAADSGAGAIRYADAGTLSVDAVTPVNGGAAIAGITRTGRVGLNTADALTLAQSVDVDTATVTLQTVAGNITQTGGTITAGELGAVSGTGSVLLTSANAAAKVALTGATSVSYNSGISYEIASVAADTTPVANVDPARNIFTATTGINGDTTAGVVELTSSTGTTVTQTQDIKAQALLLHGEGAFTLARETNDVAKFAADTGAGTVRYWDANDLIVDSVVSPSTAATTIGIDRTGNVELKSTTLTLTQKASVGTATLELNTSSGQVTQAADITAGNLLLRGDAAFELTRATNNVGILAAETGAGVIRYADADTLTVGSVARVDGSATTAGVTRTGNVNLNTVGTVTLEQNVNVGAATVRMQSTTGSIVQTGGAITASGLGAISEAGDVLLGSSNAVGTVSLTGTNVLYGSAGSYVIGAVGADVTPVANAGSARQFFNGTTGILANTDSGVIELDTDSGTVTQTADVKGQSLILRGNGGYTLTRETNDVTKLAADSGSGTIRYYDADDLAVDSATAPSSGTTVAGIHRTGSVELKAATLAINQEADVGDNTLELNIAGGTVTQAADITAANLLLRGPAAYELTRASNDVDRIAADTGGGVIRYTDANSLAVDNVTPVAGGAAVAGISRTGNVELKSGSLVIAQQANVGTATLELNVSGGTVTQAADVKAGNLLLRGGAGYLLTRATNDVNIIAADTGGGVIRYTDASALTVGSVTPVGGGSTVAGIDRTSSVELKSNTLMIAQPANVHSATLELNVATGTVTQSADITAANLLLRGGAGFVLTRATNDVAKIAADTGGEDIRYTDANALAVDSVVPVAGGSAIAGIDRTGSVELKANTLTIVQKAKVGETLELNVATGTVTQAADITASSLLLRGGAAYELTRNTNDVDTIAADSGGGTIRYWDADSLSVGSVTPVVGGAAVAGIVRTSSVELLAPTLTIDAQVNVGSATLELNSTGNVTQAAPVTAGSLLLSGGTGTFELTNGGNNVATIAAHATTFRYADADNLAVGTVAPVGGGESVVGVNASGDVGLNAGGTLTLTQQVTSGAALRLQATGDITQGTAGVISAPALGVTSLDGDILLGAASNSVTTAALAAANGDIVFKESNGYTVGSMAADDTAVAGVAGRKMFTVASGLTAKGSVDLETETGVVDQSQDITAQSLVLRGDAAYELTRGTNGVEYIAASDGAGTIRYADKDGLTVGAPDGGLAVEGIKRSGPVELNAVGILALSRNVDVGTSRLTMQAASIDQSAGTITAGTLGAVATGGDINLGQVGNKLGTVALEAHGSIALGEADGYTIGAVGQSGSDVDVPDGQAGRHMFDSTAGIESGAATGGIKLTTVAGTVSQAEPIKAANLVVNGDAAYALVLASNDVDTLAATTGSGAIQFADADDLTVGTVAAAGVSGIARTGNVTLNANGPLTLAADVNVGAANTLRLWAKDDIVQTGGVISAGTLGAVSATKSITLGSAGNSVDKVALQAAENIWLSTADGFDIGQVTADPTAPMFPLTNGLQSKSASGMIELVAASGNVEQTQSDPIKAHTLLLGGSGTYLLDKDAVNDVARFAARTGGASDGTITFVSRGDLILSDVPTLTPSGVAYAGIQRSNDVTIVSPNVITFSGNFVADSGASSKVFRVVSTAAANPETNVQVLKDELDRFFGGSLVPTTTLYLPDGTSVPLENAASRLAIMETVIKQTATSKITLDGGVALRIESTQGGSIRLNNEANDFGGANFDQGTISVRSASSANSTPDWRVSFNATPYLETSTPYKLSVVELAGSNINIGNSGKQVTVNTYSPTASQKPINVGVEGDLVRLSMSRLNTSENYIVARYGAVQLPNVPFDWQLPGLTLKLLSDFEHGGSYGELGSPQDAANGEGPGIRTAIGLLPDGKSKSWVVVEPHLGRGESAFDPSLKDFAPTRIFLVGPVENPAVYLFTANGLFLASNAIVYYNGRFADNQSQRSTLLSIAELMDRIRRETLERAVSTENVSRDLRESIVVEIGVGPAATTGSQGARQPEACTPAGADLSCR
ncbi:MAG: filamentous hemagglutinin N-terminal domain-containing protein [Burkholderiales bacterium]|nr:filamentous hemagglutinin N-terminal domain-containing protein [Burkholderiales bacterium]